MLTDTKQETLKRLNYIEGHISGIRRMVEEEKYCVDVLKQTYAVRRAIEKLESLLLDGHPWPQAAIIIATIACQAWVDSRK